MSVFQKNRLSQVVSLASMYCAGVFAAPGVFAEKIALEETIVTAERREENQQSVPVAITSYSSDALEQQGILSISDLEKSSPNTQLRASRATNSTLTAYIRGVGQQDPLWGFEPGVGVYVDDVYYARPQAAVLDVFDVDRIEVLRGPQGTLYGKNTVGGAIKYITKKMTGEAEAKVTAAIGSYNQRDLTVSAQLPIVDDTLYLGASVASLNRDGFGEVLTGYDISTGEFSGTEENYNKDVLVGRLSLEYTPSEDWFIRFAMDKTDDDSNQLCGTQSSQTLLTHPATGELFLASGDPYDSACGTSHISNVENQGFSLTASYQATDSLSFKYIYADREGETQQFIDFEATPLDSFDVPASYTDEQQSHELQVSLNLDKFNLVGGIFYFEGNSAGAFDVVLNASPFMDGTHNDLGIGGDVDTESLSYYFNAAYEISDELTLTLGARLTNDDKNSNIERVFLSTTNSFPYSLNQGSAFTFGDPADDTELLVFTRISDDEASKDWTELSPSVKLDYAFSEDAMIYLSYAEGFKSGGFDMRGNATTNLNLVQGYDPETVDTFEFGVKSQFLDDRVRLNFAVFDMDYEDMQLTVQAAQPAPIFFSSAVVNAGVAEVFGAELEALAQVTAGLNVSLSLGYLDAELVEVISAGEDVSDTWEMLNAPELTGQVAVSYDLNLGDMGLVVLNGAYSYRGASRNFNNVECSCDQDEGYYLLDVGANWYSASETWSASLHAKNLTDEEFKTGGYNLGSGELAFYGALRTVTATVSYQF